MTPPHIRQLQQRLDTIEKAARGGRAGRFLRAPLRYTTAIGYWRLIYPLRKKGQFAHARTFFGTGMEVVLPSATEIFLFGAKTHDSEIRLTRFMLNSLQSGAIFADVGAHFGYFSLLASQLVGLEGQVYSFEASRSTFSVLEKNTAPHANITSLHRAATDCDALLTFHEFPVLFSEYNSLVMPDVANSAWLRRNPSRSIEVQGLRLDNYFLEKKEIPGLVKIDVEGAEPQVLRGMEALLTRHAPTLIMEYLTDSSQRETHREAVAFARDLGYAQYAIDKNGNLQPCADIEAAMRTAGLNSDNIVLKR
ncbi:MAG: FkbM family methyltransferase [Saprospiraceae bacterium]